MIAIWEVILYECPLIQLRFKRGLGGGEKRGLGKTLQDKDCWKELCSLILCRLCLKWVEDWSFILNWDYIVFRIDLFEPSPKFHALSLLTVCLNCNLLSACISVFTIKNIKLFGWLNEIMHAKHLAQFLAQSKSTNGSYYCYYH